MKVNLPHAFKQIARHLPHYGPVLEEFEKHLRETIQGEHTLDELAQVYCLSPAPKLEGSERRDALSALAESAATMKRIDKPKQERTDDERGLSDRD